MPAGFSPACKMRILSCQEMTACRVKSGAGCWPLASTSRPSKAAGAGAFGALPSTQWSTVMPKANSVLEIVRRHLDRRHNYIGPDLSNTDKSISLAPDLGIVRFPGPVKTSASFYGGSGTTIKIASNLEVGRKIEVSNFLEVSGNIRAGSEITVWGGIYAGGCITSGGNISAGGTIEATNGIIAGGFIRAAWSVISPKGVTAKGGGIRAGHSIAVDGPVKASGSITADRDIHCQASIQAGGQICAVKSIRAKRGIRAGLSIFTTIDSIATGGNLVAGGRITAGKDIRARRAIQAGFYIRGTRINAGGKIFAGMGDASILLPGDNEVRGEIVRGALAHGQHVPA